MSGQHHSHDFDMGSKKLYWAIVINILLTIVQIVGGVLSGSLSLIADALHNFSDAGALVIAAVARRVAKLPATEKMTFGYKRAEVLGAFINSTTLLLVGGYLIYEAIGRFSNPQPIEGWTVIWVAGAALVIDILTAMLTYKESKENLNIRAAFIHNVSDALASIVVIIAGVVIIWFEFYIVDLLATLLISAYVIFHAIILMRQCILIVMQHAPDDIDLNEIKKAILALTSIESIHHIHLWQLDDKNFHFEGHIVIAKSDLSRIEQIKTAIRSVLNERFKISHSTLEIEVAQGDLIDCTQVNRETDS